MARVGVHPGRIGLKRRGWPYGRPISVPFTINEDSPQAKGLVAWFPLGPGQWGMVRDAMGRWVATKHGDSNAPVLAKDAKWGTVTLFDDSDNQHLYIDGLTVPSFPVTLMTWFNLDQATANNCLMGLFSWDVSQDGVYLNAHGNVAGDPLRARSGGGSRPYATTTTGYSVNTWHHGCARFDSITSRAALIDGGSKGTNTTSQAFPDLDHLSIGAIYWSGGVVVPTSGMLRDARVYARSVPDAEIRQIVRNPWDLFKWLTPRPVGKAAAAAAQTLSPSAIASLETFGTPQLNLALALSGIASLEAFGTQQLNLALALTGIASAETIGSAVLAQGGPVIILTGIESLEAFGTLALVGGEDDSGYWGLILLVPGKR